MDNASVPTGDSRRLPLIMHRLEFRLLFTLLAVSAAVTGFINLTSEVLEGDTARFDRAVILALRAPGDLGTAIGPRWLQESARDVTALGGATVLALVCLVAIVILLEHGRRYQAMVFGATVLIAQATSENPQDRRRSR